MSRFALGGSLTKISRSAGAVKPRIPLIKKGSLIPLTLKSTGHVTLKTSYLQRAYNHVPKIGPMIIPKLKNARA